MSTEKKKKELKKEIVKHLHQLLFLLCGDADFKKYYAILEVLENDNINTQMVWPI